MDMTGNLEGAAALGRAGVGAAAARLATAMTGPASTRDFEGPMKEAVRTDLFAGFARRRARALRRVKNRGGQRTVNDFDILGAAASGMEAQRAAMDVEARNVALAQTGDVHHPARGLVPQFSSALAASNDAEPEFAALEARMNDAPDTPSGDPEGAVVAFSGVRRSAQPVDSIGEMVSVLDAQRAYEADTSVFDIGKHLFERTLEMGRL